ncbi:MAG: hypothetical protein ACO37F_11365 [Pirellulales bacterium]
MAQTPGRGNDAGPTGETGVAGGPRAAADAGVAEAGGDSPDAKRTMATASGDLAAAADRDSRGAETSAAARGRGGDRFG